ncbi:MAG: hypothetical protein NC914_02015 [Candidatus Omnitrophica bacterium]|nr:hypothetical protein [Candidatus Omnitrophota bacterium]
MLVLILIVSGIFLRLVPHAPNFTPVAAIALFSAAYLNKRYAFTIPLIVMVISDLLVGLHDVVIFTWGGFILVTFLGLWIKKRKNVFRIISLSLVSSLLFYLVSNFGVWVMGWYPHTLGGLIECYVLALPFLRNFTFATVLYTAIFFGIYELIAHVVKNSKYSRVLLAN